MPPANQKNKVSRKSEDGPKLYKLLVGKHIGPNLDEEPIEIVNPTTGEKTLKHPSWEWEAGTSEDLIRSEMDLVAVLGPEKFAYADERTQRSYTRRMQSASGETGVKQSHKGERGSRDKPSPVGGRDDGPHPKDVDDSDESVEGTGKESSHKAERERSPVPDSSTGTQSKPTTQTRGTPKHK